MQIQEIVRDFNVYGDDGTYLGIAEEVALPNFEPQSAAIAGAGIMGEIEAVNDGHFGSQEITLPFRLLQGQGMALIEPGFHDITLRASVIYSDASEKGIYEPQIKAVIRGRNKKVETGKLKKSEAMDVKITMEVYYIKIESDGETLIEVDKTNSIYVVNGKDYYAQVRRNI